MKIVAELFSYFLDKNLKKQSLIFLLSETLKSEIIYLDITIVPLTQ